MVSLQVSCFLTERLVGTPINCVFPKMPGVPFLQSVKIKCFCSGPISVDPICPYPSAGLLALLSLALPGSPGLCPALSPALPDSPWLLPALPDSERDKSGQH